MSRVAAEKPRILLLAPAFWPPVGAEALTGYKFWRGATEQGWQIDVIARDSRGEGRYPVLFADNSPEFRGRVFQVKPDDHFFLKLRDNLAGLAGSKIWRRGWSWVYPACRLASELIIKNRYDAVVSRSLPLDGHIAGLWLKKKSGLPWIANWNDPAPLYLMPSPYRENYGVDPAWGDGHTLKQISIHADWHTFPCERLRKFIASYLPVDILSKSSVIPHVALSDWMLSLQQHDGLRFFYAGDIRPPRSAETFLEGLSKFLRKTPMAAQNIEVSFAGQGADEVFNRAREIGLDCVRSLGLLDYQKVNEFAVQSDVGLLIEADMEEGIFLPSKMIDLVQCGLPVLAIVPKTGTISDLIQKYGGGLAVDVARPDDIAAAIERIWLMWKEGALSQKLSSRSMLPEFCEDTIFSRLEGVLERLEERV
ncbi:MAG: glycosyltransferase [Desulfuromonadales bacterium]|nr:glycosyltransferase [Desulfuromonadales bacterium]